MKARLSKTFLKF